MDYLIYLVCGVQGSNSLNSLVFATFIWTPVIVSTTLPLKFPQRNIVANCELFRLLDCSDCWTVYIF